ncbi:MAG: hypothetical protein ACFFA3_12330 [Promethearchaeota archaeon]
MSEESEDGEPANQKDVIKEDVNLQFHLYILVFLCIYYSSWVVPGICFFVYFLRFFFPFVLETANFIYLFTQPGPLLNFLLMPLVLIGCYLLHLFMIGLVSRILWNFTEKMSPSKSGVIPRNVRSRTANYYHLRGFMIKYGKNSFTKGALSWLSNWFFNFVGTCKIGKGTTLEESLVNDKFLNIGSNCYIGVNSALTSHLVQGVFGNITYFEINIGDNVTGSARAGIGPGGEVGDNSYFLPLASTSKHSVIKGDNYYWGLPMRKIFRKKIIEYLELTPKELEINENIEGYKDKQLLKKLKAENVLTTTFEQPEEEESKIEQEEEKLSIEELTEQDLALDFTTSSAISRVNVKFLAVYIPIFWLAGLIVSIFWYSYLIDLPDNLLLIIIFLPFAILGSIYFFILSCILFSKLFLILVNLIHKPKEGIFKAEIGDKDFEFWMLRTEIKKIALWFMRNSPLPWTDVVALKLFGIDMDSSSHLYDAWCDAEFIKFGRKTLIGQGANVMSSMVVGKYLIIQKIIFDDYIMVGGWATIAPGTIIGKESVVGALTSTTVNQILDPGWVYFGFPAIKMKENKYAEERREVILKRDVDDAKKYEMEHKLNIEKEKKELINQEKEEEKT